MARPVARRGAVALCTALVALSRGALGQTPAAGAPLTTVAVYAPPCIGRPFDRSALGELLRVELRALGVGNVFVDSPEAATSPLREAPLAVVVVSPPTCEPSSSEVTIRVVDRTIPKSVERRMTISDIDVPERPRAIAIGIAELLAASFAELELAGAPRGLGVPPEVRAAIVARLVPAADAAGRDAARQVDARFEAKDHRARADAARDAERDQAPSVDLVALTRLFPARGTALLGAAATVRFRAGSFAFDAGASIAGGDTEVPFGSVTVGSAAGRLGAGLTTGGKVALDVGPALEVGYGWAKGNSNSPLVRESSYQNVLVSALATATLRIRPAAAWAALLGVDLGYALSEIAFEADAARVAGLGGVEAGVRAGAAVLF